MEENYLNPWTYEGNPFYSTDIKNNYGFVYCITDTISNQKYIGRKYFYQYRKPRKKSRRKRQESDWKKYYGSNVLLQEMVEQNGIERYTREILFLGETKGEVNFLEVWCQFKFDVLFSENYLNFDINGKWRKEYAKRYYKRQKERIDKLLPSPSLSKSPKDKD